MIIYKITNKVNGKIYIGQTIGTIQNRWNSHCRNKKFSLITAAINKYGRENFTIEEIAKCETREELNMREAMFIYAFGSHKRDIGYNIMEGGDNHTTHSEETKAIIAEKARNISDETRKKMSDAKKGKKQSPEVVAKRIKTGRVWSEESKRKSSEKQKGRKLTEEHKQKLSESKKGKCNPERIEAMKKANIGRKATPEQKEKYRQAALKREAKRREERGI